MRIRKKAIVLSLRFAKRAARFDKSFILSKLWLDLTSNFFRIILILEGEKERVR